MNEKILPIQKGGEITAPPSKSMAHRALICAALTNDVCTVQGIIPSQDMHATMRALNLLGANITYNEATQSATVQGVFANGSVFKAPNMPIDCAESGSTLRFMIPLFSLNGKENTFVGGGKLLKRPQNVYADIFNKQGLKLEHTQESLTTKGALSAGEYLVSGNVSSQFITGLLFALPLLNADSTVKIIPPFESESYVHLTKKAMADFGVHFEFVDNLTIKIKGKQQYKAKNYTVEGDFSQAAFWAVLAACANKNIIIHNLKSSSAQGDAEIFNVLKQCGANIAQTKNAVQISESIQNLNSFSCDIANCPDLGPILMVLALFCEGESVLNNAARLRDKESDRIAAMQCEIEKIGAYLSADKNTIRIKGAKNKLHSAKNLHGHNDHRIVMAMAVAAASMHVKSGDYCEISGAQAVRKSYPNFFEHLNLFY